MGYSVQYYDLVLVCIAASLGAGVLVGFATPLALGLSVPLLALVALAVVFHALFVNGPVDAADDLTEEVDLEDAPKVLSPVHQQ